MVDWCSSVKDSFVDGGRMSRAVLSFVFGYVTWTSLDTPWRSRGKSCQRAHGLVGGSGTLEMSSRRRRRERADVSDDDDEGSSGGQDEASGEPEERTAVPAAQRRGSLRERVRSLSRSRDRTATADSTVSAASCATINSSASCKAARQTPDHWPSVSARVAAGLRTALFSRADGYFLSRAWPAC